jgi:aminopeptidase
MNDPRMDKLARVLVNYSVNVKRGNVVRISGSVIGLPLIRAIYREVLQAGGHPLLRLADDQCADIFFENARPAQLSYLNPLTKREFELIDCAIGVWGDENTKAMSRVDPGKQAMLSQARRPLMTIVTRRSAARGKNRLRWVSTQYPCQSAAQDAEMSLSQYEDFVFNGGFLNLEDPVSEWRNVRDRQNRICDYLQRRKEMHITSPHGTDIRFGIGGRKWVNCAGEENFPDGEVFTAPLEDSTEGVICFSFPAVHGGREVQDIRLEFKAGKVVDASASKGEDFLHKMLDQDRGARLLGELAIGTNYGITEYTKNTLFDEKIGGTFHTAVGDSFPESGGKNKSALHWDMVCDLRQGGIIQADGKTILKDGRFSRANWPQPAQKRGKK